MPCRAKNQRGVFGAFGRKQTKSWRAQIIARAQQMLKI